VVAGKCAGDSVFGHFNAHHFANMDAKIKLIKKDARNAPAPAVEPEASTDPKEWSTAVKSWVKEFQKGQRDGSTEAFDSLFSDSTP